MRWNSPLECFSSSFSRQNWFLNFSKFSLHRSKVLCDWLSPTDDSNGRRSIFILNLFSLRKIGGKNRNIFWIQFLLLLMEQTMNSNFGETFIFLTKLAWNCKVTLPILVTAVFLVLDFRMQIELNVETDQLVFQVNFVWNFGQKKNEIIEIVFSILTGWNRLHRWWRWRRLHRRRW